MTPPSAARSSRPAHGLPLMLCALGACAQPTGTEHFTGSRQALEIVSTRPGVDEVLDSRRVYLDICLDRLVDPGSVRGEDFRLRSGFVFYDARVEVELVNWREGGTPALASEPWCPGSVIRLAPGSALAPGVGYRLTMYDGLRGWRGERFDLEAPGWLEPPPADTEGSDDPRYEDPRFVLEFTVDPDAPAEEMRPDPGPPRSLGTLFEPGEVFDPGGVCSCHADADDPATELLDLRDPQRAYASLVIDTRVGPTGVPRVAPGDPANSYLLHKIAREEDGSSLHAVPGSAMPPDAPLSQAHLATLSAWIYEGAAP